jgi:hypothetical protein
MLTEIQNTNQKTIKIMKKIITLLTVIFAFGQMSFGQIKCSPIFYVLEEGETLPPVKTNDTLLTIKYYFPDNCSNDEIIIDSTSTSPLGVICIKSISKGNKFSPYVLSCLKAGQNTTKEALIVVYYHYKKLGYKKMDVFKMYL